MQTVHDDAQLIKDAICAAEGDAAPAAVKAAPRRAAVDDGKAGDLVPEKRKPAPVATTALDEDGALVDLRPDLPAVPGAPAIRPATAGLPDPEQSPEVLACRANHARLAADLAAAHAERAALELELGIAANASQAEIERVAVALLVSGGDYQRVERLKAVASKCRHLTSACGIAAKATGDLLAEACRKLSAGAVAAVYRPLARAKALAFLELLRASNAEREGVAKLNAAGLGAALNPVFGGNVNTTTVGQNGTVQRIVQEGVVTAAEVKDAAPFIQGI